MEELLRQLPLHRVPDYCERAVGHSGKKAASLDLFSQLQDLVLYSARPRECNGGHDLWGDSDAVCRGHEKDLAQSACDDCFSGTSGKRRPREAISETYGWAFEVSHPGVQ
jgi:hypothetical protein